MKGSNIDIESLVNLDLEHIGTKFDMLCISSTSFGHQPVYRYKVFFSWESENRLYQIRIHRNTHIRIKWWCQWFFQVPLEGGRDYITPQKAIYKWYISGIYCQLGDYMPPTTFCLLGEPETTIDYDITMYLDPDKQQKSTESCNKPKRIRNIDILGHCWSQMYFPGTITRTRGKHQTIPKRKKHFTMSNTLSVVKTSPTKITLPFTILNFKSVSNCFPRISWDPSSYDINQLLNASTRRIPILAKQK